MVRTFAGRLGVAPQPLRPAPKLEDISLPKPRVAPPDTLAEFCATAPYERALHTYGRSYRDIVRAAGGDFANAPDFVAHIEAGILGPALEDALRPHGLTLRHFPQSFEFSSLGGWIATRSGGHFASLYTHIDDFVESLRVVTPSGIVESRRLPGSGAGPSPDRIFIGSEGILGVITEAWMRLQDRPTFRTATAIKFHDFFAACRAVRAIAQAGLYPSNARLL